MHKPAVCPDIRDYQGLASGQLAAETKESLLRHLEGCDSCVLKIQALPVEDTFVGWIQQVKTLSGGPEDKQMAPLIQRLIQLRQAGAAPVKPVAARTFEFSCPGCGKSLRVKEEAAGKKVKCPHCGQVAQAPAAVPRGGEVKATLTGQETGLFQPSESIVQTQVAASSKDQKLCGFLAPAQAPDELGRLGSYRVLKVLGAGGMGVVFRAEDPQLQRLVALKAMLPDLAANESARQRFLREARAAAKLKHDHIVTIFQVGEDRGAPFLAMEFLEGEALEDRIKRAAPGEGTAPLPLAESLRIGREIAEGLEAAHEHGLIHRDIKPGNVWLEGKRGRVKILDFGLARCANEDVHLTQSGAIVGTPAYMPPEQARGEAVDGRCDLYSLGCVLYRLCTGQLPFKGDNTMSLLLALATEQPKSVRELNADVPPALADLIMRLLAKDPAQRPATAREVADALDAIDTGKPVVVKAAHAPAPPRRRRRLAVAVAGGALLLTVMLTVIVIRLGKPEEGTVTIKTIDPNVQLAFTSGGREVTVRDGKDGEEFKLPLGTYQVELRGNKDGLKLKTNKFTLERGGRPLVEVTWKAGEQPTEARGDVFPPMKVAEPPPLAEWLKGHTILTVAQDGSGQFKTIQAALNALKSHQVVKVLDRGPYRESLRLNVTPEDTGLISEENTVLELPRWDTGDGWSIGHQFGTVDGFRLCGFRLLTPQRNKPGMVTCWPGCPSGLVIEDCCFDPKQFLDPYPVVGSIQLVFDSSHLIKEPLVVRRCAVYGGQLLINGKNAKAVILIENNYFHKTGNVFCEAERLHTLIVRSNVFDYLGPHFLDLKGDATTLQVSNNTITGQGTQCQGSVPTGGVTVRNNIIRWGFSFNLGAAKHWEAARGWSMGHNCYLEYHTDPNPVAPKTPTDLNDQAEFLSLDPAHPDYLRVPADSPLAKASAGGAWPSYIGALPPGPAPKDGDWFTRLRQRWGELAPAVKPLSVPVQIPEPPPLAEWLKGRKILTVAQDGSGQFKTIQAALDALQPGQVVKVLDRGPYRETLEVRLPEDTGLLSEQGTVLELTRWKVNPYNIKELQGHHLDDSDGFRLSGFDLVFPPLEKSDLFGYGLYFGRPNGVVLENCRLRELGAGLRQGYAVFSYQPPERGNTKPNCVRECLFDGGLIIAVGKKQEEVTFLIERNYFTGKASENHLLIWDSLKRLVIRHNVFAGSANGNLQFARVQTVEKLIVSNNTMVSVSPHPSTFDYNAPRGGVVVVNNLRTEPSLLGHRFGVEKEVAETVPTWQTGHNAYPREMTAAEVKTQKIGLLRGAKTDLIAEVRFLSQDRTHPDYLRIPADSPLAKGGAGGAWPSYIGALPPGPAPKDGDWFTRLREKWLKDKPAAGK